MSAHDHSTFVPGCFRCELSRDEVEPECPECHDKERIQLHAGDMPGIPIYTPCPSCSAPHGKETR